MNHDPKTLALRWFHEVWNLHQPETVRELMAADGRGSSEGGDVVGPEDFIRLVQAPMLAAFPDLTLDVDGVIAEGENVVTRWTVRASREDGTRFSFCGMTWMIFKDGKIVEGWDRFNLHALNAYLSTGEVSATVFELPSELLA